MLISEKDEGLDGVWDDDEEDGDYPPDLDCEEDID